MKNCVSDLAWTNIRRFADLSKLQQLPNLYSLTLHGNPIENFPNYRFDKIDNFVKLLNFVSREKYFNEQSQILTLIMMSQGVCNLHVSQTEVAGLCQSDRGWEGSGKAPHYSQQLKCQEIFTLKKCLHRKKLLVTVIQMSLRFWNIIFSQYFKKHAIFRWCNIVISTTLITSPCTARLVCASICKCKK